MANIKTRIVLVVLILLLFISFSLSIIIGPVNLRADEIVNTFLGKGNDLHSTVIFHIRLPRALAALLVGGGLALAGAAAQGLFRNPLADPGVIGASAGAALGAVIALHFALASIHFLILPSMAFVGALTATLVVYLISIRRGNTPIVTLLLAGVAVTSLAGACTALILTMSREYALREQLFWLMGGLDARSWAHVNVAAPFIITGSIFLLAFSRPLDILTQGEFTASSLGVNVGRTRTIVIILVALVTGAAVAISGIIGFVGLLVPHIIRLLIGPRHGPLMLASFLGGGILLLLADVLTRTITPMEIRLGIITSFLGVPFFLYLLRTSEGKENYA